MYLKFVEENTTLSVTILFSIFVIGHLLAHKSHTWARKHRNESSRKRQLWRYHVYREELSRSGCIDQNVSDLLGLFIEEPHGLSEDYVHLLSDSSRYLVPWNAESLSMGLYLGIESLCERANQTAELIAHKFPARDYLVP